MHHDLDLQSGIILLRLSGSDIEARGRILCHFISCLGVGRHIKVRNDRILVGEFLALCPIELVESGEVAAEAGVIVVRNFIVNVIAGDIVVIILQIRSADQCTPEGVRLRIRFIHALS